MKAKLVDQFGKPIEGGRVYGIGPSETKCVVFEAWEDVDAGEVLIRRSHARNPLPFQRIESFDDIGVDTKFYMLNDQQEPLTVDPRDGATSGTLGTDLERYLIDEKASIELVHHRQADRLKRICVQLGVTENDGTDLSAMAFRFVYEPQSVTVEELVAEFDRRVEEVIDKVAAA